MTIAPNARQLRPPDVATDRPAADHSGSARPPARLTSLTGLRFVAAFLVFAYHASLAQIFVNPGLAKGFSSAAASAGFVGVGFFFVLSGFVLTWSHRPGDTARAFWRRRAAKIYPNHLVTFVVALSIGAWYGVSSGTAATLANVFLVQAWVPQYRYTDSVNGVSWSLSCEIFFYLAFPLLLWGARRIRVQRLWPWTIGVALSVVLLPALAGAVLPSSPPWPWGAASYLQIWSVYTLPVARALEFVLGILIARLVREGRWLPIGRTAAVALFAASYVLSLHVPILYVFAATTVIPIALVIGAFARAGDRRSVLASRVMVRLGELSFAFYLVHSMVLSYGQRALGHAPGGWGAGTWSTSTGLLYIAGALVVSLALSWVLNVCVEQPVVRAAHRSRRRRATPKPALATNG